MTAAYTFDLSTLDGFGSYNSSGDWGGDAVDIVARLTQESTVPLRSHGSWR